MCHRTAKKTNTLESVTEYGDIKAMRIPLVNGKTFMFQIGSSSQWL